MKSISYGYNKETKTYFRIIDGEAKDFDNIVDQYNDSVKEGLTISFEDAAESLHSKIERHV